ncbi:hypothetical protein DIPPA_00184 [Diplonema papillatum]|nr:hypothetical protein DIPPA_00184 [Diplonema papillatum]
MGAGVGALLLLAAGACGDLVLRETARVPVPHVGDGVLLMDGGRVGGGSYILVPGTEGNGTAFVSVVPWPARGEPFEKTRLHFSALGNITALERDRENASLVYIGVYQTSAHTGTVLKVALAEGGAAASVENTLSFPGSPVVLLDANNTFLLIGANEDVHIVDKNALSIDNVYPVCTVTNAAVHFASETLYLSCGEGLVRVLDWSVPPLVQGIRNVTFGARVVALELVQGDPGSDFMFVGFDGELGAGRIASCDVSQPHAPYCQPLFDTASTPTSLAFDPSTGALLSAEGLHGVSSYNTTASPHHPPSDQPAPATTSGLSGITTTVMLLPSTSLCAVTVRPDSLVLLNTSAYVDDTPSPSSSAPLAQHFVVALCCLGAFCAVVLTSVLIVRRCKPREPVLDSTCKRLMA